MRGLYLVEQAEGVVVPGGLGVRADERVVQATVAVRGGGILPAGVLTAVLLPERRFLTMMP
jgi:hypothetical protein